MDRTEIEDKVRAFLVDDLEIDEALVRPESRLRDDMGIDSLDIVDLVVVVERDFGVKLKTEELKAVYTLSQFEDYIAERLVK